MSYHFTWFGFSLIIVVPVLIIWLFGSTNSIVNREIDATELLDNSENNVEIVFFGFVGCESVCPSALLRIGEALELANSEAKDYRIGALFADINYLREFELAQRYTAGFSQGGFEIKGIHLNRAQVQQFSDTFGLRVVNEGKTLRDIQHTDHLFVLRKAGQMWVLDTILPTATPAAQIKDAVISAGSRL
ncbi:MAG: SCO family protein [Bacteroidetes bacterium]|nr:SCO family protein [Bacteroidota bacterium]MCH8523025.1 SCO family protein [Balneolales bacterium]